MRRVVAQRADVFALNERQKKAVEYVKERGKISNKEFQALCNTTKKTATRDFMDLTNKNIFRKVGTRGEGTYYTLKE